MATRELRQDQNAIIIVLTTAATNESGHKSRPSRKNSKSIQTDNLAEMGWFYDRRAEPFFFHEQALRMEDKSSYPPYNSPILITACLVSLLGVHRASDKGKGQKNDDHTVAACHVV